jgi:membrane-bound lytic murein transglycosylase D
MTVKTQILLFVPLTSAVLFITGCGTTVQQSRFQMAFLPSVPHSATIPPDLAEPPQLNPFLAANPSLVTEPPQLPPFTRADGIMKRADQHFQRGRKYYQAHDAENARKQFDQAVDLMLDASASKPNDAREFQRLFERMVDSIHRYDLAGLGAAESVEDARFEKAPLEDILQMTFPVDPKLRDRVQDQVQATVSQLPLVVNDAVAGYIHYFEGRGHRTLIAGFERAGRYRPMIQRILDEEGLPQEIIHLAQAESGFIPRAVSRMRATGMWQFMNWRGNQYGLAQTAYVDERLDPEKATRAAARHLRDLYTEFGDWYLAIAAYNCGPGGVEKAVERTGYADFWELRSRGAIPLETTNYVPIILAMTIMSKNAAQYGLEGLTPDTPLEYDTMDVSAATHLNLIADLTDAPVSELMALNPALLKGIAPAGYSLRVPKGAAGALRASLEMIPPDKRLSWRMHKVADGETLASIGKQYGASAGVIAAANKLLSSDPVAGDRLAIPAAYTVRSTPVRKAVVQRTSTQRAVSGNPHHATATPAHRTSVPAARRSGLKVIAPASQVPAKRKSPKVLTRTALNSQP